MTNLVARQTNALLNSIGYEANVLPHPDEASMKVIINGKFVARVIEGCNALSIIILFLSFIIAFAGRIKTTVLYCFAGAIILYALGAGFLNFNAYQNQKLQARIISKYATYLQEAASFS